MYPINFRKFNIDLSHYIHYNAVPGLKSTRTEKISKLTTMLLLLKISLLSSPRVEGQSRGPRNDSLKVREQHNLSLIHLVLALLVSDTEQVQHPLLESCKKTISRHPTTCFIRGRNIFLRITEQPKLKELAFLVTSVTNMTDELEMLLS